MGKGITSHRFLFAQNPHSLPDCAEDGRGNPRYCPSVIPFTRFMPSVRVFGALAGLPGLASDLANSVLGKVTNRLDRLRQDSVLPNCFDYISSELPYVDPAMAGHGEYYAFQIRKAVKGTVVHGLNMNERSNDNHATDGKILTLGGKRD